ncbi:MAG: hypothetical protein A2010_15860 [Nitrospirae bacterium GWD2_57_9]|nr:MAG: hypothetical protein A2010_15860 [Nitrospirae bacterium GWD2_57_9]
MEIHIRPPCHREITAHQAFRAYIPLCIFYHIYVRKQDNALAYELVEDDHRADPFLGVLDG